MFPNCAPGYQISFFTQSDRFHGHQYVSEYLLATAKAEGLAGMTVLHGVKGVGHDGKRHTAGIWEHSEAPVTVLVVCTEAQARGLLERLARENCHLMYSVVPVQFGTLGT